MLQRGLTAAWLASTHGSYGLSEVRPPPAACQRRRYQGVDWRDQRMHDCNQRISPINTRSAYYGLDIDPLEVMFVKYKDSVAVAGGSLAACMRGGC